MVDASYFDSLKTPSPSESTEDKSGQPTSKLGAYLSHLAEGVVPAMTGIVGWEAGATAGAALTAPLAPVTAGVAPVVGGVVGGVLGAMGTATVTHKGQEKLLKEVAPSASKYLEKSAQEHPHAAFAGELSSMVAGFRPGVPASMGKALAGGAVGGGVETAAEAAKGEKLDPTKIGMASVAGAAFLKPTSVGQKIAEQTQEMVTSKASRVAKELPLLEYKAKNFPEALTPKEKKTIEKLRGYAGDTEVYKKARAIQEATVPSKIIQEEVPLTFSSASTPEGVAAGLHQLTNSKVADSIQMMNHFKNAESLGVTEETAAKFRDISEGTRRPDITTKDIDLYNKTVKPLVDEVKAGLKEVYGDKAPEYLNELSTRIARRYNVFTDSIGMQLGDVGKRLGKTASALKSRRVFALEDGTIITQKPLKNGYWQVTKWENGEGVHLGNTRKELKGDGKTAISGQKVIQAKQRDIQQHTPIKYVENDLHVWGQKLIEVRAMQREKKALNQLSSGDFGKAYVRDIAEMREPGETPYGEFVPLGDKATATFPTLAGKAIPKQFAEVLEDYATRNASRTVGDIANDVLIRAMMVNPYPHVMNEFVHWLDARGASGFLSPNKVSEASMGVKGLSLIPGSVKSVLTNDEFQLELLRNGGWLMKPSSQQLKEWEKVADVGFKEAMKDAVKRKAITEVAAILGTEPVKLLKKLSDSSSTFMWGVRDVLYTHLVKEQMAMGKSMPEAIKDVGKHMPEYFIPHRIIGKGDAGRLASKTMQHKALVFGKYHYGLFRALSTNVEEIAAIRKGKEGVKDFTKGVDHALAMIVGMGILFSGMDWIASKLFGKEAEQRRAGPYHIVKGTAEAFEHPSEYGRTLGSILTVSPYASLAWEWLHGEDWRGKPILQEGTDLKTKALDTARWAGSHLTPIQTGEMALEGKVTAKDILAKEMDIKLIDSVKEARKEQARRKARIAGMKHELKMKQAYPWLYK